MAIAYLIGAIPFAYLIVKWVQGIDIRTVGSGNVGATNAGRLLGFRYFLLIFALDVLKGLLPTMLLPVVVQRLRGLEPPQWLPVVVALATILGHNYPVYLGFRGGKGVATSLGAVSALDGWASLAAAAGFLTSLLSTRFVSVSSVVGALCFVVVHFVRARDPWGQDVIMSIVTLGLAGMLILRHRKNFVRIAAGTEPKVKLRREPTQPNGLVRIGLFLILMTSVLAAAGGAFWLYRKSREPVELVGGSFVLRQVDRVSTGYQRATRAVFLDEGRVLALLCPRYCRLVVFDVSSEQRLQLRVEVELEGRPMALAAAGDRVIVLQRPDSDRRHIEPGWCDTFDLEGKRIGSRLLIGYNPDDIAVSPDRRFLAVISSERSNADGPPPERFLAVHDLDSAGDQAPSKIVLERSEDDEARLTLSSTGRVAMAGLYGSGIAVAIDLSDANRPRILGRHPLPDFELSYPSHTENDRILMPVSTVHEAVLIPDHDSPYSGNSLVIATRPDDSSLEVVCHGAHGHRSLGRFPLRGPLNLGEIRPTGLAWSPERRLLAVSSRSGAVHLISMSEPAPLVTHQSESDSNRK
jgi:glycerol-3-phosphate acyltransferase PlsY